MAVKAYRQRTKPDIRGMFAWMIISPDDELSYQEGTGERGGYTRAGDMIQEVSNQPREISGQVVRLGGKVYFECQGWLRKQLPDDFPVTAREWKRFGHALFDAGDFRVARLSDEFARRDNLTEAVVEISTDLEINYPPPAQQAVREAMERQADRAYEEGEYPPWGDW